MRPPSVYAKPPCPAGCPCDVARLLYGPHRVGARLVMILLSHRGWTAVAIAELLGCDPSTVRRWIHRYNQHGVAGLVDRPRPGRPRLGSPKLGDRIRRLLTQPKAWTIARLYQRLGRPALSLRTLRRRVSEQVDAIEGANRCLENSPASPCTFTATAGLTLGTVVVRAPW